MYSSLGFWMIAIRALVILSREMGVASTFASAAPADSLVTRILKSA
jgi:hypothetical protein